jgi:hypothetical protein
VQVNTSTNTTYTNTTNKNNKTNHSNDFSNLINAKISELKVSDKQLPEDAHKQLQKQYKESFTDEKYDELIEKLEIKDLSDGDKTLIKSIIDDRVVTKDEIEDLSYEQIVTLNKFIMQKDANGDYIEETQISTNYAVSNILNIPLISDNETFNKTIFEKAIHMEDSRSFMALVTGTWNFPYDEPNHIDYDTNDPDVVLRDLISKYETRLETSKKVVEIEYYKNSINIYQSLLNNYEINSDENKAGVIDNKEYFVDLKEELIEDLLSLIKTGLTVSEVESLEKLIADINQLIEDSKERDVSEKKIEDLIKKLEQKLEELQRRMGGDGEIEADKDMEISQAGSKQLTHSMKEFKSMVLSLKYALDEIKEQSTKPEPFSTHEELQLRKGYRN